MDPYTHEAVQNKENGECGSVLIGGEPESFVHPRDLGVSDGAAIFEDGGKTGLM